MRSRNSIAVVVALALAAGSASGGDMFWDNGIVPNGWNGRAMSPPAFPDIRVADDVTFVPDSGDIQSFHLNVIEDATWQRPNDITLEVRADTGKGPGDIVATHTGEFTAMDTGDVYFGRANYDYWIEGIHIYLDSGTYWLTIRNENGGGSGTNYWMTSDGGRHGRDSSTGYFSLDAGDTWQAEGADWHHAFRMNPPEPSTGLLFGSGGLVLLRRRR